MPSGCLEEQGQRGGRRRRRRETSEEATVIVPAKGGGGLGVGSGGAERQMDSGDLLKVQLTGFAVGFNEVGEKLA